MSPIQAPVEEKPAPAPVVQEVNRPEPEPTKELLHEEDSQDDFDQLISSAFSYNDMKGGNNGRSKDEP